VASSFPALDANLKLGTFTTSFLTGNLDEFAGFADVALSEPEIIDIYNATSTGKTADLSSMTTPPVAWYRMGDNSTYKSPQILMPENTNKDKVSNYSMTFDGVDDYFNCGNISALNNSTQATWSCWFKKDPTGLNYLFGTYNNTSSGQQFLAYCGNSTLVVHVRSNSYSGGTPIMFQDTVSWSLGSWYHVAIVFDGGEVIDADKVKVYLNNTPLVNSATAANMSDLKDCPTEDFYIGKGGSKYTSNEWEGNLDEVAIWDSALSAGDVTAIYNSGTPTTISGAVAYWKLGEDATFSNNWLVPNSALDNYSKFSFNFDGVDDYIDCGNILDKDGTTPFSISAWIKCPSDIGTDVIASRKRCRHSGSGKYAGYEFVLVTSGVSKNKLVFEIEGLNASGASSGAITRKGLGFDFNDDVWHHVVATYDGSEDVSGIKLYKDGAEWTTFATYQDLSNNFIGPIAPNATIPFCIGGDLSNSTCNSAVRAFLGNIDEVSFFDSELDASQVTAIYNSGEPTTITGAAAHWRMGEDAHYNATAGVSGNTTADVFAFQLNDGGATFLSDNISIGDLVRNTTDDTITHIAAIVNDTQIIIDDDIFPVGTSSGDGYKITGPVVWTVLDQIGSNDGTSSNMSIQDLQGEAPNYSGAGASSNMYIEDRVSNAPNSENNALSYNMYPDDIDPDIPS